MGAYKSLNRTMELDRIIELSNSLPWYTLYTYYKLIPIFRSTSMNLSILIEANKAYKKK